MDLRRKLLTSLFLCLALGATGALAGCGVEEEENFAVEGEALELGPLSYNVQITRFLNPSNLDDRAYLGELGPAPAGQEYLAVFLRINNESEEVQAVPTSYEVVNSREVTVEPIPLENEFALDLTPNTIPAGGTVPALDTPARSGPIKGSMLLFLINQTDTENRPLELEINSLVGPSGTVELDI